MCSLILVQSFYLVYTINTRLFFKILLMVVIYLCLDKFQIS